MDLSPLLDSRFLLITGKGGAGKTTLAAAVARLNAERGKRVVIAEIDSHRAAMTSLFGVEPAYVPAVAGPGLYLTNIRWMEALEEWLDETIAVKRIVRLVLTNHIVQLFLNATPGARETVILSRLMTLRDQYDQVIVDMPASGHALSLLSVPDIAVRLMKSGPVRERSQRVIDAFAHPSTTAVVVSLPEEMVVNETIELWQGIRKTVPRTRPPFVVLNRCASPSLSAQEIELLVRLRAEATDPAALELLRAGTWEADLERATGEALERLRAELQVPVLQLQRLGRLGGFDGGPERLVHQVASALARANLDRSAP